MNPLDAHLPRPGTDGAGRVAVLTHGRDPVFLTAAQALDLADQLLACARGLGVSTVLTVPDRDDLAGRLMTRAEADSAGYFVVRWPSQAPRPTAHDDRPWREIPRDELWEMLELGPDAFLMDDVVEVLTRNYPVAAYVEQTGGGCATLYATPRLPNGEPDLYWGSMDEGQPRTWLIGAGPGSFGWGKRPSIGHTGEWYVGPDYYLDEDQPSINAQGGESVEDLARVIAEQVERYRETYRDTHRPEAT